VFPFRREAVLQGKSRGKDGRMSSEFPDKSYEKLLKVITGLYGQSQGSMLRSYWLTGKYIMDAELKSGGAGYGRYLIERLSGDLTKRYGKGFSQTSLKNMRRFFQRHPEDRAVPDIEWSKYLVLLSIGDLEAREEFARRAAEEDLTRFQLKRLVEIYLLQDKDGGATERVWSLGTERGELFCYRNYKRPDESNEVMIDCGFNVWRSVNIGNIDKYSGMDIFRTVKRRSRYYISEVMDRSAENLKKSYTYRGYVENVIDGDTLQVNIDLGFGTLIRQKLRLRGVDTPEIDFEEGVRARVFVKSLLAGCPCVVVKTYKTDMYDRYISDVFYREGESDPGVIAMEGELLNRRLIEEGLARAI